MIVNVFDSKISEEKLTKYPYLREYKETVKQYRETI